jgi:hypothetical protein
MICKPRVSFVVEVNAPSPEVPVVVRIAAEEVAAVVVTVTVAVFMFPSATKRLAEIRIPAMTIADAMIR